MKLNLKSLAAKLMKEKESNPKTIENPAAKDCVTGGCNPGEWTNTMVSGVKERRCQRCSRVLSTAGVPDLE